MSTTLLQEEAPAAQASTGHSPLNQAFSAALETYISSDRDSYCETYKAQVGRDILFVPECDNCIAWPVSFKPASPTVRIGYVLDATTAPYVRDVGHGNLGGLDVQLAGTAIGLINGHYDLQLTIVWVPAPAGSGSLLSRLYQGLVEDRYDIVFSGQMILPASDLPPGVDPDWTSASALIGPAISYTGKGGLDFKPVLHGTRQSFIDYAAGTYAAQTLVYFSVVNPGPSTPAATALVGDLHIAGCEAFWTGGEVAESDEVMLHRKYAFAVGDCIAGAWQSRQAEFEGLYLGIPAVKGTPSVEAGTLVQVAPFTLKV